MKLFQAEIQQLNPELIKGFKSIDLDYWLRTKDFQEFISHLPTIDQIKNHIESRKSTSIDRTKLVDILLNQHIPLNSEIVNSRIRCLLNDNTYTIICAHQPLLLGGPLYWWYKIAHTIGLCNELNLLFPEFNFVAIYYSGSEDHDFEEINHFQIFNKNVEWNNSSEQSSGANGRRSTLGLKEVFIDLKKTFTNDSESQNIISRWEDLLQDSSDYGDFYFKFFYSIFKDYNIVYFNPDDSQAKELFIPYILKEINSQIVKVASANTISHLIQLGYKPQAYVHDINLFYLVDHYRTLIQKKDDQFITKDNLYSWTSASLKEEVYSHPERFSPNVVLRPMYQELLFPNIIFVGGGAEIAYWMQLKKVFEQCNLPYPILWRRFSSIIYTAQTLRKITELNLSAIEFIRPIEDIIHKFISTHSVFDSTINSALSNITKSLDDYSDLASELEQSFYNSILSEMNKLKAQLNHLHAKVLKTDRNRHDQSIVKIQKLKEQLFPQNNLQERVDSGVQFYLTYGSAFVDFLIKNYSHKFKATALLVSS